MRGTVAMAAALALLAGCSALGSVYVRPGYGPDAASPIKRITVAGWAPKTAPKLAEVMALETADLVKLRKNYLVYQSLQPKHWAEGCVAKADGVLLISALDVRQAGEDVELHLAAELYRCADGELVWRTTAHRRGTSNDGDLAELTHNYANSIGQEAKPYAAPSFVILQEVVAALPDPVLNDADIEEKIQMID